MASPIATVSEDSSSVPSKVTAVLHIIRNTDSQRLSNSNGLMCSSFRKGEVELRRLIKSPDVFMPLLRTGLISGID